MYLSKLFFCSLYLEEDRRNNAERSHYIYVTIYIDIDKYLYVYVSRNLKLGNRTVCRPQTLRNKIK